MRNALPVLATLAVSLATIAQAHNGGSVYAKREEGNRRHAAARQLGVAATTTSGPSGTIATPSAPPLSQISSGMPSEVPLSLFTTFTPGASAPIAGATPLPSVGLINTSLWPTADHPAPTDSPELATWMAAVKAANIPANPITKDGTCLSDPELVPNAGANGTCWWTCGGCTRDTDIVSCPDKNTYGVSYDDGPSTYTPKLLDYLYDLNLTVTFFVVGSRALYAPQILQTEYMLGHSLSVHTWSHQSLTSLTNEGIVAELGWTMIIMKYILGVTPNTFRPPYGDIDDRVRAVAKVMGLTPIIWTGVNGSDFDTDDWRVAQGLNTSSQSLTAFEAILDIAGSISTGFIVLSHDLYQVTVDLAIGVFLPLAKSKGFALKPIHDCLHQPLANFYIETYTNSSSNGGGGSSTQSTSGKTSPTNGATPSKSGAATPTKSTGGHGVLLLTAFAASIGMMLFGARALF